MLLPAQTPANVSHNYDLTKKFCFFTAVLIFLIQICLKLYRPRLATKAELGNPRLWVLRNNCYGWFKAKWYKQPEQLKINTVQILPSGLL